MSSVSEPTKHIIQNAHPPRCHQPGVELMCPRPIGLSRPRGLHSTHRCWITPTNVSPAHHTWQHHFRTPFSKKGQQQQQQKQQEQQQQQQQHHFRPIFKETQS